MYPGTQKQSKAFNRQTLPGTSAGMYIQAGSVAREASELLLPLRVLKFINVRHLTVAV